MITRIVLDVSFENKQNQPCSKTRTFRGTSPDEAITRMREWLAQNGEELGPPQSLLPRGMVLRITGRAPRVR
jgi:hypothetical protein